MITYERCFVFVNTATALMRIPLLFDDNNIKMARKPRKKQKENSVGCNGEDEKEIREMVRRR